MEEIKLPGQLHEAYEPKVYGAPGTAFAYISKAWGYEKILVNSELYCLKELHIWAGHASSLHRHKRKDETYYLRSGRIKLLTIADAIKKHPPIFWLPVGQTYRADTAIHIPKGLWHAFQALEDSVIVEVSTHHDDKDVERDPDWLGGKIRKGCGL